MSIVYFAKAGTRNARGNKLSKIDKLCDAVGVSGVVAEGEQIAVKLHFGEMGNDTHLNPVLVRRVVDKIKAAGGKPFLTDTCTLYNGQRHCAVDHLHTAYMHGFTPYVVDAPVIIADGLNGESDVRVNINCKHFKEVRIASAIAQAPSMVVLSHFKGHQMAGFGGAIKNLAMGCASPAGKQEQHGTKVQWKGDDCVHCLECISACPQGALSSDEQKNITVDGEKCVGCFECITVCCAEPKALSINWTTEIPAFMERLTEYAWGAVKEKAEKVVFLNFVMNVTPDCDCVGWSDQSMVNDIGILASTDPVALDQACFDLVSQATCLNHKMVEEAGKEKDFDKFTARWGYTCGEIQLSYGEEIGLGSRQYELKKV